MALKDKLGSLTQKVETERQNQAQEKEAVDLKPVRINIKKLDKEKKSLEMLKGSLDFKDVEDSANHEGMQDYALNTKNKIEKESGQLENLMTEHKEALDSIGVENRDQLMSNPEFAEEEEVVNYKKALERGEVLKMSDDKLKEKLKSHGIEIDDDKFSYEAASQAVEERLKIITPELINEKLKTPEGREDIIKGLAEEFEKSVGDLKLQSTSIRDKSINNGGASYNYDESFSLDLDRDSFHVDYKDDKAIVSRWSNLKLIPEGFEQSQRTYGAEITQLALEKAYQNKIHDAFVAWDENGDNAISLKEQIKPASPEENKNARQKMDEVAQKLNGLLLLLQEKSNELKEKGIEFNPKRFPNYGPYSEIICLNENTSSIKYINEVLDNNNFPPRYDSIKLQKASEKLIDSVDKFTEAINNLETKEDVENFLLYKRTWGTVFKESKTIPESFHETFLDRRLKTQEYNFILDNNRSGAVGKLTGKCKTYGEAEQYLDKLIEDGEKHENMVFNALKTTIEAQLKIKEIDQEMKEGGSEIGNKFYDLESKIKEVSRSKEQAIRIIDSINSVQADLPQDEHLTLENGTVFIDSIKKEYEELMAAKPIKKQALETKKTELTKHENSKPALFGKEKWQIKLDSLKLEKDNLENEYNEIAKNNGIDLWKKAYRTIEINAYPDIEKMVKAHKAEGTASEIFGNLRLELMKLVDAEIPAGLMQKYNEYKNLEAKLSGKE